MIRYPQLLVLVLLLAACVQQEPTPTPLPTAVPTHTPRPPTPTPLPTIEVVGVTPPVWPTAVSLPQPLSRTAVSLDEQAVFAELAASRPPERDDVALAMAYSGVTEITDPPQAAEVYAEGDHLSFNISNLDTNTVSEIDTALLAVSDHAYFWFDTGPGSIDPDEDELAEMAALFDEIYELNVQYFGSEANPGIDGDPRVHIVHASPLALCDVTVETAADCGFAGYFSSDNVLPPAVEPSSNAREMFIMNITQFGTNFYRNVLGHEFRHMIEDNYDRGDADWEAEGSATLAEELLGYTRSPQLRGNLFMSDPDLQLNAWSDTNRTPHYGMGYVLNRYIYDRLGAKLYREFATSPGYGLDAVTAVAEANGLPITGESLWLDWLAALAIHNEPTAPEMYQFKGVALDTAAMTAVSDLPFTAGTTVNQFAADYYALPADTAVTVTFTGDAAVPLLDTPPISGARYWYAQRANYSNPRLTRTVDLRDAAAATLEYWAYVDIEQGYDFAYVSVSTDDGRTWQPLVAENMQGLEAEDNPADSALAERFYTGELHAWFQERVDLSAYAGQEILLRFEYVTDLILTYGGFALDNIAIPEIGFFDDAGSDGAGWTAEGFVRATAVIPQQWHIQLITFEGDMPVVELVALADGRTAVFTAPANAKSPILIIAASAPDSLQTANYQLTIEN